MSYYLRGKLIPKGERGYSAYEIAVQHGFIGTEEEWLASLEAGEKASIVQEIASTSSNETIPSTLAVYTHVNGIETSIEGDIGDLSELETTETDSLVEAINELQGEVGDLSDLDTTAKTDLVSALNETLGIGNIQTEYVGDIQGRYIKFGNGLMICYNSRTMQIPIRTAQDDLYYGDKNLGNLPATFTGTPVVIGMASGDSHGWVERIYGSTSTFWGNMRVLRTSATDSSGYSTKYTYVAIGFWK